MITSEDLRKKFEEIDIQTSDIKKIKSKSIKALYCLKLISLKEQYQDLVIQYIKEKLQFSLSPFETSVPKNCKNIIEKLENSEHLNSPEKFHLAGYYRNVDLDNPSRYVNATGFYTYDGEKILPEYEINIDTFKNELFNKYVTEKYEEIEKPKKKLLEGKTKEEIHKLLANAEKYHTDKIHTKFISKSGTEIFKDIDI